MVLFQSGVLEWQKIFLLAAGVCCFGALIFLFLGSGNEQPWSNAVSSHRVAPSHVQKCTKLWSVWWTVLGDMVLIVEFIKHYSDATMSAMASQITSLAIVYSTVDSDAGQNKSKLRVTGLCAGSSPGTGEFPAQMASNAENVSIWWRHHGCWTMWHSL